MKIMQSLADCSSCKLLDAPSCILDTNSKSDLSKVEVIFIAENPGKDEVEKEKPLVGRSGKTFRKFFDKHIKKDYKWLLTNTVLCLTLDENGNTGNPDDETIERCKVNCFQMIKACNPKLIVLMGTSPMKAFGIAKHGITKLRGQIFKWEGFDVLLTVHPSFVNRNPSFLEKFEADIKTAASIINISDEPKETENSESASITTESSQLKNYGIGQKGKHQYKIPSKFYTDEYRLVDIQFLNNTQQVLYIFRDRENNKVFHKESDEYFAYQVPDGVPAKKVMPYDELEIISIPYKEKIKLDSDVTYEGDLRITTKHAIDYYHNNKGEAPLVNSNIMFSDIEVDVGKDNKTFPQSKEALYPINLITSIYQNPRKKICYILDNGTEPIEKIEGVEFKIFKNERNLLQAFIRDFKKYDPDYAAGWNFIGFDMEYIYNRMKRLKIPISSMSNFGEFFVDGDMYLCKLAGCVVLDQMHLYKMFTFTKMENYKLDYIANHEIKARKLELPVDFNKMYWEKLNILIQYNIRDTELLEKLEDHLAHIVLLNELRSICTCSFEGSASAFGQVDSIMVSFLKSQGLASKNADPHIAKKKYPGAFVLSPEPGIYSDAVDFDFTSLYPSIIRTYNIGLNNFVMKTKDPTIGYDLAYAKDKLPDVIEMILDPMFENKEVKMSKEDVFKAIKDQNLIHTINGCFYKNHKDSLSYYSQVLTNLLDSRKHYKKLKFEAKQAGDKDMKNLYHTKQLVYKVLANSLYGVIANKSFRFFNLPCAAAITLGGQEALKASIIEGDNYMAYLHKNKEIDFVRPEWTTKQEMYADKMEREHDYIITGDTDSIFCCFQDFEGDKSDEQIHKWCAEIQSYLNETIMKEIVESHNASYDDCFLELKNELIISRGLFLAKKRYAIHVTNNEGVVCDQVNYMGIEVKRSDYPSASKEFMKELLDIILKSENVTLPKLFRYVDSKEREFRHLIKNGDKSIARPVSFGKPIKQYKTIPQGVKAMMAFNEISYKAHFVGSRAYMFRVAGIDLDKAPQHVADNYTKNFLAHGKKLEVVAIPDEEPRLPEYYIPDVKGNLGFCFKDRYELMLKPLMEVKKKMEILTI